MIYFDIAFSNLTQFGFIHSVFIWEFCGKGNEVPVLMLNCFTADSLCVFPPKSVKLKKPFAIQPWIKSEENVGNLLMVGAHYDFYLFAAYYI